MKRAYTYNLFRSLVSVAVLAAATAGLAACAKESVELAPDRGGREIHLNTAVASSLQGASQADNNAETKAALEGPVADGGPGAKAVLTGISLHRIDSETALTNYYSYFSMVTVLKANRDATGKLTDFTTKEGAAAPQLYPENNYYTHYLGYYPAPGVSGALATWTVDGKTDILCSGIYNAGRYSAPKTGTMTFDHLLAQLRVVCTADPSEALSVVQAAWGTITKIELLESYQYVGYNSADMTLRPQGGPAAQSLWNTTYGSQTLAVTLARSTTTPCAAGMFVPALSGTAPLKLKVYSTVGPNSPVEVEVQLKSGSTLKGFEAGKTHTVTLTFGAKDKPIGVATTSIEAWADAGTGSGEEILPGEVEGPSSGIIDMRNPELIKSGDSYTITSTQESYNTYVNTESNAAGNGGYCPDAEDAMSEPAYVRFEVAKTDEPVAITWSAAWDACKAKAPAGAWRLPRESELWVMYWNLEELKKTPGFSAFHSNDGDYYTSAVERSIDIVWSFRMIKDEQGHSSTGHKGSPRRVRCVREVPLPAVGNYYYADGSFSSTLVSGKSPNGVIYYVDSSDPRKFKVIALDVVSSKWAVSNGYRVGALSLTDGKGNSAAIKATFDAGQTTAGVTITQQTFEAAFPAAAHCYNYQGKDGSDPKGTWYLPALTDLQYLWCAFNGADPATWGEGSTGAPEGNTTAQGVFNGYLSSADGEEIISEDGYVTSTYWSSTEYKNPGSYTWYVRFFVGRTGTAGKNGGMSVRCVREN